MTTLTMLTRYDDTGASSRVRFEQYRPRLQQLRPHWTLARHSLLDGRYLTRKFSGQPVLPDVARAYLSRAGFLARAPRHGLWWIEKELWPWAPAWLERAALRGVRYALDLDDAIFHNYDLHRLAPVRALYGAKIDRLMAGAALVTAGNDYIAQRARRAGARRVEILPTVVDLDHYPDAAPAAPEPAPDDEFRIGWIGSPSTAKYLELIAPALRALAQQRPIRLVAIGAGTLAMPGVPLDLLPWRADAEAAMLGRCHVGVMPLTDTPWERGKCGYKLLQYMACGLPVVASPVGANRQIVADGHDGFLADDTAGWVAALSRLAAAPALRTALGRAGRRKVETDYCYQVTAPRLAGWIDELTGGARD